MRRGERSWPRSRVVGWLCAPLGLLQRGLPGSGCSSTPTVSAASWPTAGRPISWRWATFGHVVRRGCGPAPPRVLALGSPLADATERAIELARAAGATITIAWRRPGPLLEAGRSTTQRVIRDAAPDLLFANAAEAAAFLGDAGLIGLLAFAPLAVVKQGSHGATVLTRRPRLPIDRFEVAARVIAAADTTGAGDAFDAGFLAAWLAVGRATRLPPSGRPSAPAIGLPHASCRCCARS